MKYEDPRKLPGPNTALLNFNWRPIVHRLARGVYTHKLKLHCPAHRKKQNSGEGDKFMAPIQHKN